MEEQCNSFLEGHFLQTSSVEQALVVGKLNAYRALQQLNYEELQGLVND